MTTPAGWYDDGSGRQRWWDGQQWTEHFAPEAAAPAQSETTAAETVANEPAGSDPYAGEPSLDDTVVRGGSETVITPEAGTDQSAPAADGASQDAQHVSSDAQQYDAPQPPTTSFTAPAAPPYVASAAPVSPAAPPAHTSGGYPGSASPGAGAYPYADAAAGAPKKVSILGLVGLGISVLGTILVFIPLIGLIGFVVLAAGFIVSLISVFLKGKKWPGIAGLSLAVVGTILGVIMSFVYLFAFAQGVSEEYDRPSSSATAEATPDPGTTAPATPDAGTTSGARPTASEIAEGLKAILAVTGTEGYTQDQLVCLGDAFVVSDLDDATLRAIADSDGTLTDMDAATGIAEVLGDTDTVVACLTP